MQDTYIPDTKATVVEWKNNNDGATKTYWNEAVTIAWHLHGDQSSGVTFHPVARTDEEAVARCLGCVGKRVRVAGTYT
jgi:hypothetical protein